MKCAACQTENNYNANFCKACGTAFTQAQKDEACSKTWIGKLNQIEDTISWLKLEKITGNPVFRALVLVVLIGMCIFNLLFKGNMSIILPSEDYQVTYIKNEKSYTLTTDLDVINLQLNLKQNVQLIVISTMLNNEVLDEKSYTLDDLISLEKAEDIYYIINIIYENKVDSATLYINKK